MVTKKTRFSKNFTHEEFVCKCGKCPYSNPEVAEKHIDLSLIILLEHIRLWANERFGNIDGRERKVLISSGIRCKRHNMKVGGRKNSRHLPQNSDAADIIVEGVHNDIVYNFVRKLPYANLLGLGKTNGGIHVDTRGDRERW